VNRLVVLAGVGMLVSAFTPWVTVIDSWSSAPFRARGIWFAEGGFVLLCAVVVIVGGCFAERSRAARTVVVGLSVLATWVSFGSILDPTSLLPSDVAFFEGPSHLAAAWGLWLALVASRSAMRAALLSIRLRLQTNDLLTANS
jgi:hypothetical protein